MANILHRSCLIIAEILKVTSYTTFIRWRFSVTLTETFVDRLTGKWPKCIIPCVVMLHHVKAQDDCIEYPMDRPRLCYECVSYILSSKKNNEKNNYSFCGNPFNISHSQVVLSVCEGYCYKWERDVGPGVIRHQRGCTKSISVKMRLQDMCVSESRPRSGLICFCDKNKCNSGVQTSINVYLMTFLVIFVSLSQFKHIRFIFDGRG